MVRYQGRAGYAWVVFTSLMLGPIAAGQSPSDPNALPDPQPTGLAARPLLFEPAVQREIKLTGAQRERLANLDGEVAQARQALTASGDEEGGEIDFAAMVGQAQQVEQERAKAVGRILTGSQKQRLTQLEWQRDGWLALGHADVATRLRLRPDQRERLATVFDRLRQGESSAIFTSAVAPPTEGEAPRPKLRANLNPSNGFIDPSGGGFAGGMPFVPSADETAAQEKRQNEAFAQLRATAAQEVGKILLDDQKASFRALLGPRFDFRGLRTDEVAPNVGPNRTEAAVRAKGKK